MSSTPRHVRLALALFVACAAYACDASAQTRAASAPVQGKSAAQPERQSKPAREAKASEARAREERARAERARRKAVAILLEVAGGAKAVEDLFQRASILTLCADALWEADAQAARSVFTRAWETAAESDDADLKDEQEQGRYGDLPERFTRARDLVLAVAARRDTRMSEGWLGALADWLSHQESRARSEDAPGNEASRDVGQLNEFTRDGQRLGLAYSLLDAEEYEAAARVATPGLKGGVSGPLVEFLLTLREGSPEEADRLYLQLLASVHAAADSDANDVLLLSSYVLTPRLLAVVNRDGSLQFRAVGDAPDVTEPAAAAAASARVRSAFYDTAAAVLLRPALPAAAGGGDAAALYFAAGRLLPFFERDAPQHAPALHTRLAELAAALEGARRAALDSQMQTRSVLPENPTDPLRSLLDTVERVGDPALRDSARMQVVEAAAKKRLWERARRLAEEIEDQEKRRAARTLIDMYTVAWVKEAFSGDEDDFERVAALVRAADVSPPLCAYGFARAAELAARRGVSVRAEALLGEALSYASQTETGTSPRDGAAMAAATVAARAGSPRAWEALTAAVAALNEDEMFDGDLIWFNLEQRVKFAPGEADALNEAFRPFNLADMFEAAARRDFGRAVAEARNLKSVGARSRALITAAGVALEQNGRAGLTVKPVR
jgi:hypothetical protein